MEIIKNKNEESAGSMPEAQVSENDKINQLTQVLYQLQKENEQLRSNAGIAHINMLFGVLEKSKYFTEKAVEKAAEIISVNLGLIEKKEKEEKKPK